MHIVVCDDDKDCCTKIEKWVKEYKTIESVDITVDVFYSAETLIEKMKTGYFFDMIFLDIELPKKTGIDLGKIIVEKYDERLVSIIFISGKNIYCEKLFDLEPQNFHLKPIEKEMVFNDLKKYVDRNRNNRAILKYNENGVKKGIYIGDIIYIEAREKNLDVYTNDGKMTQIRGSIKNIEDEFGKYYIVKCHKSYAVNAKYIERYVNKNLILSNGKTIAVGRKYVQKIKEIWSKYEEDSFR